MDELKIDAKKLSQDEQYQIRKNIVRSLKKGIAPDKVAVMLDVSRSHVYATKKTYDEKGIEGIKRGTRGRKHGDKRLLTSIQESAIIRTITDKNPDQLKLNFSLWTRKAIHEYILREYMIDIPHSTLGYYLNRWGFCAQRPLKRADDLDALRVKAWINDEYPMIAAKAKAENAEIYWGDKTALRKSAKHIQKYVPVDNRQALNIEAKLIKFIMLSAVSNRNKLNFIFTKEHAGADSLLDFMKRLVNDAGRKVLLILDNYRVHHSETVAAWLEEHKAEIELFYLRGAGYD